MSFERFCIRRVNRRIFGHEIEGVGISAHEYYGTSLSPVLREIHARFDLSFAGREALFLINCNQQNIQNIPIGSTVEVFQTDYWEYYSSAVINEEGDLKTIINIEEIGSFAIGAFCPIITSGVEKEIILGG